MVILRAAFLPLLLLSPFAKVESFSNQCNNKLVRLSSWAPPIRDHAISNKIALLSSSSSQDHINDDDSNSKKHPVMHRWWHPEKVLISIINSLLKGMSIPFPQLRDILQRRDSNNYRRPSSSSAIGLGLRECVTFLFSYMVLGVVSYSFLFEKFTIVDALYFTAVCFSTVGYGDLCPTTAAGKIFTCFFGVAGVAFLGAAVATICSAVEQAEVEAVKKVENASKRQILTLFSDMPKILDSFRSKSSSEQKRVLKKVVKLRDGGHQQTERLVKPCFSWGIRRVLTGAQRLFDWTHLSKTAKYLPSLSIILFGGAVMGYLNGGWSILESVYYSAITASTIGLGDFSPMTPKARLFAIFYIPLSVGAFGELLSGVATARLKRRQKRIYEDRYHGKLTLQHLRAMDTDHNGFVTREEYCFFMLKEMGLVSQDEIDDLLRQFDELDVCNSGVIDQEDLRLMAQLRGADVLE